MKSRFRIIAAVEIGTSKIVVLVGLVAGNGINIIGFGEEPSVGVIKGVITDSPAASEAVHRALTAAEKNADAKIQQVFIAQSGGHIDGFHHDACINVGGLGGSVSKGDIVTLLSLVRQKELPAERCVIHYLQQDFFLDGLQTQAPQSLRGKSLSLGAWHVHGDRRRVGDNLQIFSSFGLPVTQVLLSGIASGEIVTSEVERRHGALVIDIGAGTTDYVYYKQGRARVAGVLPVGGHHLTNDLSLGLRLTTVDAEKIKRLHGRANVSTKDRQSRVLLFGDRRLGEREIPRMTIEQITAARMSEIFKIVRKKIEPYYVPYDTLAGIILTGGTARLPGIEEEASRVFEIPARKGVAKVHALEKLCQEEYSTVMGLLHLGMKQQFEDEERNRTLPAKVWRKCISYLAK